MIWTGEALICSKIKGSLGSYSVRIAAEATWTPALFLVSVFFQEKKTEGNKDSEEY